MNAKTEKKIGKKTFIASFEREQRQQMINTRGWKISG
jgi:hypothetical protein